MKSIGKAPRVQVVAGSESLISSAGGSLLLETTRVSGLAAGLSEALSPWRRARAIHDPAKVLLDMAITVAHGGDCLADIALLRSQPGLFGAVASDPTVSRLIAQLADDVDQVVPALRAARAAARERVWSLQRPVADGVVIVDLDATLVTAHSDKEGAAATYKRGFGFHPLLAFVDHGAGGTGEPLSALLREGNAGANTAADHILVLTEALAQLPEADRTNVLVRGDGGAGTKDFLNHISGLGLEFTVGFSASTVVTQALDRLPRQAWRAAINLDGQPRDGAQIAELTRYLPDMTAHGWPAGMRLIVRRERPHPGAQLRLTDRDGWRLTLFATNTKTGRLADLERRHRARARAEDRIRALKDTGLRNLPLHELTANHIWVEIVGLAADLLAWTQTLALTGTPARQWEPKRLRLRVLHVAGRLITTGRKRLLKLPRDWPWAQDILDGHQRLAAHNP